MKTKPRELSAAEIDQLAADILSGRVFISTELGRSVTDICKVFKPIASGILNQLTKRERRNLAAVWEYYERAVGALPDGKPVFESCYFIFKKDLQRLAKLLVKKKVDDAEKRSGQSMGQ